VFQQLARCGGGARPGGPPPGGAVAAAAAAAAAGGGGKPATTPHQLAHDLFSLNRLYIPPQSAAADHFKPPFFPGEARISQLPPCGLRNPNRFLSGCHKRRLTRALSVLGVVISFMFRAFHCAWPLSLCSSCSVLRVLCLVYPGQVVTHQYKIAKNIHASRRRADSDWGCFRGCAISSSLGAPF